MDRTDSCTLSRNKPIHSANCAVSLVCPIVCRALALKSVLTFKSFTFLPFSEEYMQKYREKKSGPRPTHNKYTPLQEYDRYEYTSREKGIVTTRSKKMFLYQIISMDMM